ncbi:hypothetical protein M0811_08286 [Anaeramoeba ignava]|uniref:Uncharacterized protein n=1 Tax=Anaeramoeba ignava TaxID=1746090 RepID=A0A9Q0RB32_ANAIG|nr:hypothetical protein M0811_08286 [Anaeramoeba ignava]
MTESYQNIVRGRLRFKGGLLPVKENPNIKKRSRRKKRRERLNEKESILNDPKLLEELENVEDQDEINKILSQHKQTKENEKEENNSKNPIEVNQEKENTEQNENEDKEKPLFEREMTESEKLYYKILLKREKEKAKQLARTSHRQRVEEFNERLASLPEHHDIPKVGPG